MPGAVVEALRDADRDQEVADGEAALGGRVRSSRGMAIVIEPPVGPRPLGPRRDRGRESSTRISGRSLVPDGADDRDAAREPRRIGGGEHGRTTPSTPRRAIGSHGIPPASSHRPPARTTIRPPTTSPAAMPQTTPTRPRTPASTTTIRQTWRRVIPMARSTPISRTRSTTPIVSVLTMPSAATMTATTARASNTPKTRSSASRRRPGSVRSGSPRGRGRGPSRRAGPRRRRGAGGEADRRRRRRRGRPGARGVRPADEDRLAAVPGIDRSTMPATRRSAPPSAAGMCIGVARRRAERRGEPAGRIAAPPASRPRGPRAVAVDEGSAGRRRGRRRRRRRRRRACRRKARSNDAIG